MGWPLFPQIATFLDEVIMETRYKAGLCLTVWTSKGGGSVSRLCYGSEPVVHRARPKKPLLKLLTVCQPCCHQIISGVCRFRYWCGGKPLRAVLGA